MLAGKPKYCLSYFPGKIIRIGIICLLFILSGSLHGQNISNLHFEKIPDDGLANSYIGCMAQDGNGFMWFGTSEGLFLYNGYNFKPFISLPGDNNTLASNKVQALYAESRYVWIGTAHGLNRIDINTHLINNIPTPGNVSVDVITPENDHSLWIGTHLGLFRFNTKTCQWLKVPLNNRNPVITSIADDKKGHLCLTTKNGFYYFTQSNGSSIFYQPDIPVYPADPGKKPIISYLKAFFDAYGNVWMGIWDGGLAKFDPKTGKITTWSHPTDDVHFLPYKIVADLMDDDHGNIWLANKEGGLTIFSPSSNKFWNYPVDLNSETKFSGGVIRLFRDRCGIYWIGTENGIYKYDPHSAYASKTNVLLKTDTGLVNSHIAPISMYKDDDGVWWMGMYEGIYIYDAKTHVVADYNKMAGIPESFAIFNIVEDKDGSIWFTARNLLVKVIKDKAAKTLSFKTKIYSTPDIQTTITGAYIDHEGRMWLGTGTNGVFRFDMASEKFISYPQGPVNPHSRPGLVQVFCELSKDSLLMGGDQTGLLLLHTNSGRYEKIAWQTGPGKYASDLTINDIYHSGENIWLATEYNGLWQTDTRFKNPAVITVNDGLPSMQIESITPDAANHLWLSGGVGVVKYDLGDKKLTLLNKKDGMANLSQVRLLIDGGGRDIIVTSRGCIYNFRPDEAIKNTVAPRVYITDLRVFDNEINLNGNQTIQLDYDQNYFTLEYVGLNYTQPRLNHYAYKMDGLDKKWNDAGGRRYVSYANLDEGTYVFNVKASNNEGIWTTIPAKLTLVIMPPFWHRWWFYLLVVLVIATILYSIYVYNINQLKMRQQLRDKIARDLHDDIGSTLSGINIFSKMALQKISSGQQGSGELLEKISDRSAKTMDALSDIVWSINTRNDGIDNLFVKAKEYLAEILEPQGIGYEFETDQETEHLKLGMIVRKELYLIFKEAICNASKYADCSFVKVSLTRHKDKCVMLITDDGKGFDTSHASSGNGIYNMRQRAEKMNGSLIIHSENGKGTSIELSFHIPRFR